LAPANPNFFFFYVLFQLKLFLYLAHSPPLIKVQIACLLLLLRTPALSTATKDLDRPDSWTVGLKKQRTANIGLRVTDKCLEYRIISTIRKHILNTREIKFLI